MPEVRLDEVRRFMVDCLVAVGAPEEEAKAHADLLMHADTVGHYGHGLNRLVANMPEVRLEEVRRFMVDCLVAVGAPEEEAKAHADLLMHADTVGHYSHGLNRLEFYINDIRTGVCVPTAKPVILKEKGGTAWVDGCLALGATIGNFCMDLAIKKAKEFGVSWISAKHCNHYGMAVYWALKAERAGLIGISSTNSSPTVVPTRAKKIEMKVHEDEPIPSGWALGANGKPTTNALEAYKTALLMPLGGEEKSCGYKGYCLASMIETFCSGLSDSNPSYKSRLWTLSDTKSPLNFGQLYAAIDPDCFAPGFGERLGELLKMLRNLDSEDPSLPVIAPGDLEDKIGQATKLRGTVSYPEKLLENAAKIAKNLALKPLEIL